MGRVYLGVSPGGRPVAVKAIRAELAADPQFRTRFGREVAAARRVSGVFTAQVVDADVDGPVAWMATAYVPGPSLADAVESHGPLPEASLLALAAGLAESLGAIHAAGAFADHLLRQRDGRDAPVIVADHVDDFRLLRGGEHRLGLLDIQRQRLFAQDVFAVFRGGDGHLRVQIRRRDDVHNVNQRRLDDFAASRSRRFASRVARAPPARRRRCVRKWCAARRWP